MDVANGDCSISGGGTICRCVVTSEWNVEGGRLYVAGFFESFPLFSGY